jgi:hypothetical protein
VKQSRLFMILGVFRVDFRSFRNSYQNYSPKKYQ